MDVAIMPEDTATIPVLINWPLRGSGGATIISNSAQKGIDPIVMSKTHAGASFITGESICGINA